MTRVHAKHTFGSSAVRSSLIANFLFPSHCVSCGRISGRPSLPLCVLCTSLLEQPALSDVGAVLHESAAGGNRHSGTALWFYRHDGPVPHLHRLVKYGGCERLGVQLGILLAERLRAEPLLFTGLSKMGDAESMIIPIPLHPIRLRERGFNQAASIARGIGRRLGIQVRSDVLARTRFSSSQVGKSREARRANLKGAFEMIGEAPLDAHVILVDDVITTGATMIAALDVVAAANARSVTVLALALAPT